MGSLALLLLSVLNLGQTTPGAVPAARQAGNIAIVTINGPITPITLDSVHRRLQLAVRAGADAVVIELDTPGGDFWASMGIADEIKGCPIKNTVAWIRPNAWSGGAIVAVACREIVCADPASLGDAIIIAMDPIGQLMKLPESERQKLLVPLLTNLVDSARRNHYDEFLVQGIAARGVEIWMVQNNATGQRLFINRQEYKLLFGEDPTYATATITAAPPTTGDAAPTLTTPPAQSWLDGFEKWVERSNRRRGGGPGHPSAPAPSGGPTRFVPAAPSLESAARGNGTEEIEPLSSRPVLTSADQGRWTLKEYVSSGAGPLLFKTDQMLRYGLASATVQNDAELKKFLGAKNVIRLDQSWSEGLVLWLTWTPIQGLLVVIFLIALFVEMTHPGVMLPGAIAFGALVLLIAPPLLINLASWWVVAAIGGGILMLALEILVIPGTGITGVLGLLLLFGGLIGVFVPSGSLFPDSPQQRSDLLHGVTSLFLSVTTAGVGMYFIARNFKSLPLLSRLILKDPVSDDEGDDMLAAMAGASGPVRKGMIGVALTPLRPAGRVELGGDPGSGGRILDVVADIGYIPAGARVRVASVSEFRIGVELAPDPGAPGVASA